MFLGERAELAPLGSTLSLSDAWEPRVVVIRALAEGGIDGLLEALEAHTLSVAPGRRLRDTAAAPLAPVPDPAAIAPGDADGWRARLQALAARDGLCAALGITVLAGGPGRSEVAMTVEARHLNFNGGCHGGAIFSLADSAFGLASNSHGPLASGIAAHITYQAGVRVAAAASPSTGSTSSGPIPTAARRRCRASPARSRSGPEPARAEGYTGGCCPVDCRQNDNLASKFS